MSDLMAFCCLTSNKKPAPVPPVKKTQIVNDEGAGEPWDEGAIVASANDAVGAQVAAGGRFRSNSAERARE